MMSSTGRTLLLTSYILDTEIKLLLIYLPNMCEDLPMRDWSVDGTLSAMHFRCSRDTMTICCLGFL